MAVADMSDKEVQASISLLHMMQPSPEPATGSVASSASQDALHDSLLKVVASQAADELEPRRQSASKKTQRRSAHLMALTHELTLDELRAHFGKPIVVVAKEFGICTTFLKKICRRLGVKRWPHRQIRSLARTIQMLEQVEALAKTPQEKTKYGAQIAQLKEKQRAVMENPDANGKLKRMKRYTTPGRAAAVNTAASSTSPDNVSTESDAAMSDVSTSDSGDSHGSSVKVLAIAANSFLHAQRSENATTEALLTKEPLAVVMPQSPPLGVQIPPPSASTAPTPTSLTTPSHAAASIHTPSPLTLKISPSNRKLVLVKAGADAQNRLRSSSIGSLQDQPKLQDARVENL